MNFEELVNNINIFDGEYAWVTQVFIIVFGSLVLDFIQKHVINKLHRKLEQTKNLWDDLLVVTAKKPLTYIIWLMGFTLAAEVMHKRERVRHIFNNRPGS